LTKWVELINLSSHRGEKMNLKMKVFLDLL